MKRKIKLAFLTVTVGLIAASVQAQTAYNGDLLVGFTKQSGNDLIYDLGAESSLYNGETWNLSSLLSGFTLSTVNWGIIGSKSSPTPRTAWTTVVNGNPLVSNSAWSALNAPAGNIYQNFTNAGAGQFLTIAASDDNSWNTQTVNPDLPGDYANAYGNPNVQGLTSDSFYQVSVSSAANPIPPTQLGGFTLASNGVLTYNVLSSAPPAPKIVLITRSGSTSTIYFTTTNGPTYALHYTNSTGLTTSVTNWPVSSTTLVGNGLTNSLQDVTTDAFRFYRVSAH
jgi:hypothetical protein